MIAQLQESSSDNGVRPTPTNQAISNISPQNQTTGLHGTQNLGRQQPVSEMDEEKKKEIEKHYQVPDFIIKQT